MTHVFPIPPASGRGTVWFLIGVMVLLLGLCALMGYVAWSTKNSRAEVTPQGLKLVGDLWGRTIPYETFVLDDARIVDLRAEPDLQPRTRTMGTGLRRLRRGVVPSGQQGQGADLSHGSTARPLPSDQ